MKERPILFSAPLVRAILDGKKTVTRRTVKLPPSPGHLGAWEPTSVGGAGVTDAADNTVVERNVIWHTRTGQILASPYGDAGDRLWVREAWASNGQSHDGRTFKYRADAPSWVKGWKPSIHMPRAASRLTLEIADVRVERLQDITDEDIEAEGVEVSPDGESGYYREKNGGGGKLPLHDAWIHLWDGINGARAAWASNPWVWRVAFRRLP